jgi:hypothetical protein
VVYVVDLLGLISLSPLVLLSKSYAGDICTSRCNCTWKAPRFVGWMVVVIGASKRLSILMCQASLLLGIHSVIIDEGVQYDPLLSCEVTTRSTKIVHLIFLGKSNGVVLLLLLLLLLVSCCEDVSVLLAWEIENT